jgi:ABC-type lipoprotein release transport system permease subunit
MNKNFINFIFTLIYQHKSKHIAVFIISFSVLFLLISTMFVSSSLKNQLMSFTHSQPDFVVQQIKAGKRADIPTSWINEIKQIKGISLAQGRVYGQYYHLASDYSFVIVGIDVFDDFATNELKTIFDDIDISEFINGNYMIIGSGVKEFFDANHYQKYYNFLTPDLEIKKVDILKTLDAKSSVVANDMIIMDITLARQILGIENDYVTDILLNVPNDTEWQNIKVELIDLHHNIKIITKEDLEKSYTHLYNYTSGFFLILFMILLLTFCLILYQRYSMINSNDKKEIAILRSVGWSIKDVVILKVSESTVIGIFAFLFAFIASYIYVFFANAPILREFFLGSHNIKHTVSFVPFIDFGLIVSLFLFFISFFVASILIPSWKIAVSDIDGSLR